MATSESLGKKRSKLKDLIENACEFGATEATVISTNKISVDNNLASKCKEPRCENYGSSKSCPPYVSGPSVFRKLLEKFHQAIFFKIDVPSEILFSGERHEIFRLLHKTAAGIEKNAIKAGYANSHAYAGGSCKQIFCCDHPECRVVAENGKCRNPRYARPSMSGYGIDVSKLFEAAGWAMNRVAHGPDGTAIKMASVCGLILVG